MKVSKKTKNFLLIVLLALTTPLMIFYALEGIRNFDTRGRAEDLELLPERFRIADLNQDGAVNLVDFALWLRAFRKYKDYVPEEPVVEEEVEGGGGDVIEIEEDGQRYRVHIFRSDGEFTINRDVELEYMILAGGGGGGARNGGGGGAGGLLEGTTTQTAGSYSVVVGAGGRGGTRNPWASWEASHNCATTVGWQGGNSSVFGLIAIGGGGGGGGGGGPHACHTPSSGGSGGGGGRPHTDGGTRAGGSGTSGQGGPGGAGTTGWSGSAHVTSSGGGGSPHPDWSTYGVVQHWNNRLQGSGDMADGYVAGGNGGYGVVRNITGSNVCYAGGGGGCPGHFSGGFAQGGGWATSARPCAGLTDNPKGGAGSCGASNHGVANTGGGVGNDNAGWGGSGIVIIRYAISGDQEQNGSNGNGNGGNGNGELPEDIRIGDLNGDGKVDLLDFQMWVRLWREYKEYMGIEEEGDLTI